MKLFDTAETERDIMREDHTHSMTPTSIIAEAELRHWKALDIQIETKPGQSLLTIKFDSENGASNMKKMIDAHIKQLKKDSQEIQEKMPASYCILCGTKTDPNAKHGVCEHCIKETIKRELRQKSRQEEKLDAKHKEAKDGHCLICEKKIDEKNELKVCDHCVTHLLHKRFMQIGELQKAARQIKYQRMSRKPKDQQKP
ncbi:MAG: hypothetical protein LBC63_01190 [Holophagales bacterium]|jgi:hypothetical protein|nr:hypothetical protein [Holophagales bacterium]